MTAKGEEVWEWRNWRKRKRTHGHGQQYGGCWRKRGLRGLNGNGKNTVKIKFLRVS